MEPWILKYQPRLLEGLKGQNKVIEVVRGFVAKFPHQKKKSVILYGPPGCGKTSMVHLLAKEFLLELVEVNASDFRNRERLEEKLKPVMNQRSLFGRGKIILIDEIDGLSGSKDRGGIQALTKLMKNSTYPIIFTANDPWDSKFSGLRKKSDLIKMRTLAYTSVRSALKSICDKEMIQYDDLAITSLARRAGGDMRGAINDLQTLTQQTRELKKKDVEELGTRNQTESMINALIRVFKTTNPGIAREAFGEVDEGLDQIFLWIDENLSKEYTKPADIASAYDKISRADVYRGRIRRWQHWRYLVYIYDLLTAGVALSKKEKYKGFIQYGPTQRIIKIWQANMKNKRKKAIANKIAAKTHTSARRVMQDTLPFFVQIIKTGKAQAMIQELNLSKEELDWIIK